MPANQSTGDEVTVATTDAPLEWGTSSFVPGSDVGLVSRHTVGLIERENPSTRERLWRLVADDAPLDDILDELSSTGLKALPDFGIAQAEGSNVRVVARGRTTISVELSSGSTHEIDPSGVRTWIEEVVADVAALTITLPPLDGDPTPALSSEDFAVLAGSVPAAAITRRYDVADVHAEIAVDGWSTSTPGADSSGVEPEPAAGDVDLAMAEPEAKASEQWFDEAAPSPAPTAAVPADPQPASPPPPDAPPADPQPPSPPGGSSLGGPPEATVVVGSQDGPTRGPATSLLGADDSAALDRPAGGGDDPDGIEGATISAGPVALGVLAFSNGERVVVDRSVLIGRNPKVAGAVEGGLPRIMKFDGPGQGLSRTHAEVRIVGGEMLLEDLQSTNGTEVEIPGQARRRVLSGSPVVVVPGTVIDFGDELQCTVEAAD